MIEALIEYVDRESDKHVTGLRDLTLVGHLAEKTQVPFHTLATWIERPERVSPGIPFPIADRIICATGQVDLWRGPLADYYENVDMGWVQCEAPDCDRWFRQGHASRGPTIKRFCSKRCGDAAYRLRTGIVQTRRKNYGSRLAPRKGNKCRNGHERTPETTKIRKNGKMECLLCHRDSAKRAYRKAQDAKGIPPRGMMVAA